MESTANHRQVLALSQKVDSMHRWFENGQYQKLKFVDLSGFSNLGNLQQDFQIFEQSYRQFVSYLPGSYYTRKKEMLKRELEYKQQLLSGLKAKKKIQKKQYKLARKQFEMKKELHQKELIALSKFIKQRSQLLSSHLPLQQINQR